jgi:hypothetical protein
VPITYYCSRRHARTIVIVQWTPLFVQMLLLLLFLLCRWQQQKRSYNFPLPLGRLNTLLGSPGQSLTFAFECISLSATLHGKRETTQEMLHYETLIDCSRNPFSCFHSLHPIKCCIDPSVVFSQLNRPSFWLLSSMHWRLPSSIQFNDSVSSRCHAVAQQDKIFAPASTRNQSHNSVEEDRGRNDASDYVRSCPPRHPPLSLSLSLSLSLCVS